MLKNIFITSALLLAICFSASSADIPAGKNTFQSRCTACHAILSKLVGPALKDVDKRHDEKWILNFVHSSQSLVKKGDPVAVKLFNENGNIVMPDHADLSDADILNVIAYIKDESAKAAEPLAATPAIRPVEVKPAYTPISFFNYGTWVLYTIVVVLLVVVLFTMVIVKSAINEYKEAKLIAQKIIKKDIK
jgi:cytochrome c551/c552